MLSFAAQGLPDGLSIDAASGRIGGTPTRGGTFAVTVTATDSSGPAQAASFTWAVSNADVTNPGSQTGTIGNPSTLQIQASAADGGTLSYAASDLPTGLTIDPTAGDVTGTPESTGTFDVTVTVTDSTGGPAASATFTWTINSISLLSPGAQVSQVGQNVDLGIPASDSDGGTLSYQASGLPAGLQIDGSTGTITGSPTTPGDSTVTVTVSDAEGGSRRVSFGWHVNQISLTSPGPQSAMLRALVALPVSASDSDGGALTYAAQGLPQGLGIDPTTGAITGAPTGSVGTFAATLSATDADGGSKTTSLTWTVTAPPADGLLISEVRLSGPGGTSDRYVDVSDPTASAVSLAGWQIGLADATSNTSSTLSGTIPAGGHLLVADTGYQQVGPAPADMFLPFGVASSGGVRLVDPAGDTVDAVGFTGAPVGYSLGTPLKVPSQLPTAQFTWVRNWAGDAPADTLDNQADFTYVAAGDNDSAHGSPVLGTPNPSDLASPVDATSLLASSPAEPSAAATPQRPQRNPHLGCPRDADRQPQDHQLHGTASNRRVRRGAGRDAAAGGHRPSPPDHGLEHHRIGDPRRRGARSARLRGRTVARQRQLMRRFAGAQGLTLDPPSPSGGGGLNSSWTASSALPQGGLPPGACVNLEFEFAVLTPGPFTFQLQPEGTFAAAQPATPAGDGSRGSGGSGGSGGAGTSNSSSRSSGSGGSGSNSSGGSGGANAAGGSGGPLSSAASGGPGGSGTPSGSRTPSGSGGLTGSSAPGSGAAAAPPLPHPPAGLTSPSIAGSPRAGSTLICTPGIWSGSPLGFLTLWSRDGTPLPGATGASYAVQRLDEGSTLTCTVSAANLGGTSRAAISRPVAVAVPHVRGCPAAGGALTTTALASVRLGMSRAQVRKVLRASSRRATASEDFFCLTPAGISVGYASAPLLRHLRGGHSSLLGHAVWLASAGPRYAIHGIRPGSSLKAARAALPAGRTLHVGATLFYVVPAVAATDILEIRHGIVQEVALAASALTRTSEAQLALLSAGF